MPFEAKARKQGESFVPPKPNSLVVCAGTVTVRSVGGKQDGMLSGFLAFKTLFSSDLSWKGVLQPQLDLFFSHTQALPSYIKTNAQANGLIGCVATVPDLSSNKGLGSPKSFEEQYKDALRGAVLHAQSLNRPLYIQPLGIGVYGWDAKKAAGLFADVFKELDHNSLLDITIPIYNPDPKAHEFQQDRDFMIEINKLMLTISPISAYSLAPATSHSAAVVDLLPEMSPYLLPVKKRYTDDEILRLREENFNKVDSSQIRKTLQSKGRIEQLPKYSALHQTYAQQLSKKNKISIDDPLIQSRANELLRHYYTKKTGLKRVNRDTWTFLGTPFDCHHHFNSVFVRNHQEFNYFLPDFNQIYERLRAERKPFHTEAAVLAENVYLDSQCFGYPPKNTKANGKTLTHISRGYLRDDGKLDHLWQVNTHNNDGTDYCGTETNITQKDVETYITKAIKKQTKRIRIHMGETMVPRQGQKNVAMLLSILKEKKAALSNVQIRIGHGTQMDFKAMSTCQKEGFIVEACLSSNKETGIINKRKDYPLALMMLLGVNVVLGTDGGDMYDTTLIQEYWHADKNLKHFLSKVEGKVNEPIQLMNGEVLKLKDLSAKYVEFSGIGMDEETPITYKELGRIKDLDQRLNVDVLVGNMNALKATQFKDFYPSSIQGKSPVLASTEKSAPASSSTIPPASTFPSTPEKGAFSLGDNHCVTAINDKGNYFEVLGKNNSAQVRSIQVYKDGNIKNPHRDKGKIPVGTPETDSKMQDQRVAVFLYFGIVLPVPKVSAKASSLSRSPALLPQPTKSSTPALATSTPTMITKGSTASSSSIPAVTSSSALDLPSEETLKSTFIGKRAKAIKNKSFLFFWRSGVSNAALNNMSFSEIIKYAQKGKTLYSGNRSLQVLVEMNVLDKDKNLTDQFQNDYPSIVEKVPVSTVLGK